MLNKNINHTHTQSNLNKAKVNTNKSQKISNYPLALINVNNDSFSNTIIQLIVHMNRFFRTAMTEISVDNQPNYARLKLMYDNLYDQYFGNKKQISSFCLRQYVADCQPSSRTYQEYIDGRQQEAFLFFIDFLSNTPEHVKRLFKFKTIVNRKCSCNHTVIMYNNDEFSFEVPFEASRFTNFQGLFIQATQTKCSGCDKINNVTESTSFDIPVENRYVVINFHCFNCINNIAKRIKSKIYNFNPDSVVLPGCTITYRIHSFIIRIGETLNSGHYYLWTRNLIEPGWIQLNDSKSKKFKKIYESIENVNFLVLEQN